MGEFALVPCFKCGVQLQNCWREADNQPQEGTKFTTYGHYGSTFWDSFDGEQVVLNICDECLRENTERLLRHKRYRNLRCYGFIVGREWLKREMIPYFDGPEDNDPLEIEPEEIGTREGRIEWVRNLDEIRESIKSIQVAEEEEHEPSL